MATPVERFEEHAQQIEPLLFLGDSNSSAVPIEQLKERNIKNILIAGMGLTRYHPTEEVRIAKRRFANAKRPADFSPFFFGLDQLLSDKSYRCSYIQHFGAYAGLL